MAITSQLISSKTSEDNGLNLALVPTLGVSTALALSVMSNNYRRAVENRMQRNKRRRKMGDSLIAANAPKIKSDLTTLLPKMRAHVTTMLTNASNVKGSVVNFDKLRMIGATAKEDMESVKHSISNIAKNFDEDISKQFDPANIVTKEDVSALRGSEDIINARNVHKIFTEESFLENPKSLHLKTMIEGEKFRALKDKMVELRTQMKDANSVLSRLVFQRAEAAAHLQDIKDPAIRQSAEFALNDANKNIEAQIKVLGDLQTQANTHDRIASYRVMEEIAKNEGAPGTPLKLDKVTIQMLEKRGLIGGIGDRSQILRHAVSSRDSFLVGERAAGYMNVDKDLHAFAVGPNEVKMTPSLVKFNKVKALSKASTVVHHYMKNIRKAIQHIGEANVADDYLLFQDMMPKVARVSKIQGMLEKIGTRLDESALDTSQRTILEKRALRLWGDLTNAKSDRYHTGTFEDSIETILDHVGKGMDEGKLTNFDMKLDIDNNSLIFRVLNNKGEVIDLPMPMAFGGTYASGERGKNIVTQQVEYAGMSDYSLRSGETYQDASTRFAKSIKKRLKELSGGASKESVEKAHRLEMMGKDIALTDQSLMRINSQVETAFAGITKKVRGSKADLNRIARRAGFRVVKVQQAIYDRVQQLFNQLNKDGSIKGKSASDLEARIFQAGESLKHTNMATIQGMSLDLTQLDSTGHATWDQRVQNDQTLNSLINQVKTLEDNMQRPGERGIRNLQERGVRMGDRVTLTRLHGQVVPLKVSYRVGDSVAASGKIRLTAGITEDIGKAVQKFMGTGKSSRPGRKRASLEFTPSADARFGKRVDLAQSAGWLLFKADANLEEEGEHYFKGEFIDDLQMRKQHTGTIRVKHHIGGEFVFDGLKDVNLVQAKQSNGEDLAGAYEVRIRKGKEVGVISLDGKNVHVRDGDVFHVAYHPNRTGAMQARIFTNTEDIERLKVHLMNSGLGTTVRMNAFDLDRETKRVIKSGAGMKAKDHDEALVERMSQRVVGHASYKSLFTNVHDSVYTNVTHTILKMTTDAVVEDSSADLIGSALTKGAARTEAQITAIKRVQDDIRKGIKSAVTRLQTALEAGGNSSERTARNLAEHFRVDFKGNHSSAALKDLLRPIIDIKDESAVYRVMRELGGDINIAHFMTGTGEKYANKNWEGFGKFNVAFKDLIGGVGEKRWFGSIVGENYTREEAMHFMGAKGPQHLMMHVMVGATPEHKLPHERIGTSFKKGYLTTKGGMSLNMDALMMLDQGGQSMLARHHLENMRGRRQTLNKRYYFTQRFAGIKTDDQIIAELKLRGKNRNLNPYRVAVKHTIEGQRRDIEFRQIAHIIAGGDKIDKVAEQTGQSKMHSFTQAEKNVQALRVNDRALMISNEDAASYFKGATFKQRLEAGILSEDEFSRFQKFISEHPVLELADEQLHIAGSSANRAQFGKGSDVQGILRSQEENLRFLYMPSAESMKHGITHRKFDTGGHQFVKLDNEFKDILKIFARAVGATNDTAKGEVKSLIEDMHVKAAAREIRTIRNHILKTKADGSIMGLATSQLGFAQFRTRLGQGVVISKDSAKGIMSLIADPSGKQELANNLLEQSGVSFNDEVTGAQLSTSVRTSINKDLLKHSEMADFQIEHNTRAITRSKFKKIVEQQLGNSTKEIGGKIAYTSDKGFGTKAFEESFEENFGVIGGVMKSVSKAHHDDYKKAILDIIKDHRDLVRKAHVLTPDELLDLRKGLSKKTSELAKKIADVFATSDKRMINQGGRYPMHRFGGIKPMMLQIIDDRYMTYTQRTELNRQIATDRYTAGEMGADNDGDFIYSLGLFRKSHADEALREQVRRNMIVRHHNQVTLSDGSHISIRTVDTFLSGSTASSSLEYATDGLLKDIGNDAKFLAEIEKGNVPLAELNKIVAQHHLRPDANTPTGIKEAVKEFIADRKASIKHIGMKTSNGDKTQYIVRSELVGKDVAEAKERAILNISNRLGVAESKVREIVESEFARKIFQIRDTYGQDTIIDVATIGFGSSDEHDIDSGTISNQTGKFKRFDRLSKRKKLMRRLKSSHETWSSIANPEQLGIEALLEPDKHSIEIKNALKNKARHVDMTEESDRIMAKIFTPENEGHLSGTNGAISRFHASVRKMAADHKISYAQAYGQKIEQYKSVTNLKLSKDARVIMAMEEYMRNKSVGGANLEALVGVKQLTGALATWQNSFQSSYHSVLELMQSGKGVYTDEYSKAVNLYMSRIQQNAISMKHGNSPVASGIIDAFKNLSRKSRMNETVDATEARVTKAWKSIWEGQDINVHLSTFEKMHGAHHFGEQDAEGRVTIEGKVKGYRSMNSELENAIKKIKGFKGTDATEAEQINAMINKWNVTGGKQGSSALYHIALDGKITGQNAKQVIRRLEQAHKDNRAVIKGYEKTKQVLSLRSILGDNREELARESFILNQTAREATHEETRAIYKMFTGSSALKNTEGRIHEFFQGLHALQDPTRALSGTDTLVREVLDLQQHASNPDAVEKATEDLRRAESMVYEPSLKHGGVSIEHGPGGRHFTAMGARDHIYEALGGRLKRGMRASQDRATGRSAAFLFAAGLVGASALMPSTLAGQANGLGGGYFDPGDTKNEKKAAMHQQNWLARRMTSGSKYIRIEDNRFRNLHHTSRKDVFQDMLNSVEPSKVGDYKPQETGAFYHG